MSRARAPRSAAASAALSTALSPFIDDIVPLPASSAAAAAGAIVASDATGSGSDSAPSLIKGLIADVKFQAPTLRGTDTKMIMQVMCISDAVTKKTKEVTSTKFTAMVVNKPGRGAIKILVPEIGQLVGNGSIASLCLKEADKADRAAKAAAYDEAKAGGAAPKRQSYKRNMVDAPCYVRLGTPIEISLIKPVELPNGQRFKQFHMYELSIGGVELEKWDGGERVGYKVTSVTAMRGGLALSGADQQWLLLAMYMSAHERKFPISPLVYGEPPKDLPAATPSFRRLVVAPTKSREELKAMKAKDFKDPDARMTKGSNIFVMCGPGFQAGAERQLQRGVRNVVMYGEPVALHATESWPYTYQDPQSKLQKTSWTVRHYVQTVQWTLKKPAVTLHNMLTGAELTPYEVQALYARNAEGCTLAHFLWADGLLERPLTQREIEELYVKREVRITLTLWEKALLVFRVMNQRDWMHDGPLKVLITNTPALHRCYATNNKAMSTKPELTAPFEIELNTCGDPNDKSVGGMSVSSIADLPVGIFNAGYEVGVEGAKRLLVALQTRNEEAAQREEPAGVVPCRLAVNMKDVQTSDRKHFQTGEDLPKNTLEDSANTPVRLINEAYVNVAELRDEDWVIVAVPNFAFKRSLATIDAPQQSNSAALAYYIGLWQPHIEARRALEKLKVAADENPDDVTDEQLIAAQQAITKTAADARAAITDIFVGAIENGMIVASAATNNKALKDAFHFDPKTTTPTMLIYMVSRQLAQDRVLTTLTTQNAMGSRNGGILQLLNELYPADFSDMRDTTAEDSDDAADDDDDDDGGIDAAEDAAERALLADAEAKANAAVLEAARAQGISLAGAHPEDFKLTIRPRKRVTPVDDHDDGAAETDANDNDNDNDDEGNAPDDQSFSSRTFLSASVMEE